jgi:hypothetical protein
MLMGLPWPTQSPRPSGPASLPPHPPCKHCSPQAHVHQHLPSCPSKLPCPALDRAAPQTVAWVGPSEPNLARGIYQWTTAIMPALCAYLRENTHYYRHCEGVLEQEQLRWLASRGIPPIGAQQVLGHDIPGVCCAPPACLRALHLCQPMPLPELSPCPSFLRVGSQKACCRLESRHGDWSILLRCEVWREAWLFGSGRDNQFPLILANKPDSLPGCHGRVSVLGEHHSVLPLS